jgi:hypothetical protein
MIVETTHYFAKPGLRDDVLIHRRKGSALRVSLGLPAGEIFVNLGDTGPDVRWECYFADQAALDADLLARDRSPEFAIQRQGMGALLDRFERHIFTLDDQGL